MRGDGQKGGAELHLNSATLECCSSLPFWGRELAHDEFFCWDQRLFPQRCRIFLRLSIYRTAWIVFTLIAGAALALAQVPPVAKDRIVQPINNAQVATISGNLRPWARPQNDQGEVSDSFRMDHMSLVFKFSEDQQADLTVLLQQLQDRSSPQFHKWLTPDEFASRFGPTRNDIDTIVAWLENDGFTVDRIARSRTFIVFSGTAGQVETAFSTPIHRYLVDGQTYYANASNPTVPAALANVVLSFRGLDNFRLKPGVVIRGAVPVATARYTSTSGVHYLAPADWTTIYDLTGLYEAEIDGQSETIAVMGQTDVYSDDFTAFFSTLQTPAGPSVIILVPSSSDPGVSPGDLAEADLDLEWSKAIAANATVLYVNSGAPGYVFDSLSYTIDEGLAPVISISYGACEADWGTAGLNALAQEAEQANAQGMTIVAGSGDQGAAGCDEPANGSTSVSVATHGYAVAAPASLPYVTAVGGTEFNEGLGNYWSSTNGVGEVSALSYIPEIAWNDTAVLKALAASGGGASMFFAKPSWQTGPGGPDDGARDVPDVSFSASPVHDPYLICTDGSCDDSYTGELMLVGGTSAGTPAFAAVVALIDQEMGSAGQGNINYVLYPMAASFPDAFHDITTGNNDVPCEAGSIDCPASGEIGYSAGPGYNQVTGLGSLDVSNLVTEWKSFVPASSQGPDFQMDGIDSSLAVNTGSSGSATLTLMPLNGFDGAVNLSCAVSVSLSGATCSVSPASITLEQYSYAFVTVTIPAASASFPSFKGCGGWAAAALTLAFILLCGMSRRISGGTLALSRTSYPVRRLRCVAAGASLFLFLIVGSLSCSGGGSAPSSAGTSTTSSSSSSGSTAPSLQIAPVSSTVTVTGTANTSSGTITHSVVVPVSPNG